VFPNCDRTRPSESQNFGPLWPIARTIGPIWPIQLNAESTTCSHRC
jgi:hypothetical protein